MIRVAQAGSDEKYQYRFGQAGDQRKGTPDANGCFTGELNVQPWYNKPWDYVLRCKDSEKADIIAQAAQMICKNKNVGYDQNQDETLWDAFERLGWNLLAIPSLPLCETDCCRLADVSIRLAGITSIPNLKHKYTGNIREALVNSGLFYCFSEDSYTQHDTNLRRGDLLLQEGHHLAIVLDNSEQGVGIPYRVTNCIACYLRSAANTGGKILATLHPGDVVSLHGWTPNGWGIVDYNGKSGYVSGKFLKPARQVMTTEKVWLRSGAGKNTQGLTAIPRRTVLPWDGRTAKNGNTTWYAVSFGGYNGFASGLYIKVL